MGEVKVFPGNDGEPLSIQGVAEQAREETLWASDAEHRAWLEDASDGWVTCKERVRHGYRRAKRGERLHFRGKTKSGYYVRRELCPDCKAVELVELWMLKPKRGTKNIVDEAEMVLSYPNYVDKSYLATPGTGRYRARTFRQIIVTEAMAGVDLREIEREIAEYEASQVQVVSAS